MRAQALFLGSGIDDQDVEVARRHICSQQCCDDEWLFVLALAVAWRRAAETRSGDRNVGQNIRRSGVYCF